MTNRLPLTVLFAIPIAACASGPEVRAFDLTAPEAPVELLPIPFETVTFAWTFDAECADDVRVTAMAVPTTATGREQWLGTTALAARGLPYVYPTEKPRSSGLWTSQPPPSQIFPGVYRVSATAVADEGSEVLAESTAAGLLVVQGVTFRDFDLTFTADVNQRDLWMTTVTATTARATIYLTGVVVGPRWVISESVIASDLAPVGHVVTFTGRTVDDVAIPAGDYRAMVELSARGGTVTYEQYGPVIHWRP